MKMIGSSWQVWKSIIGSTWAGLVAAYESGGWPGKWENGRCKSGTHAHGYDSEADHNLTVQIAVQIMFQQEEVGILGARSENW